MPKKFYAQDERSAEASTAVPGSVANYDIGRSVLVSSADKPHARIASPDGPARELGATLNWVLVDACWVVALLAGTMLAVSGVGKLANLPVFAVVLHNLFGFGGAMSAVLSVGISALEVSAGVTLIVHPRERLPSAIGAALFAGFFMIQGHLAVTGSTTDCGCFGTLQGSWLHRISQKHWVMLALDGAFAATLFFDARSRVSQYESKTTVNILHE
jgi:hypothetical protein